MTDYTREELIAICEAGVVPHEHWSDRDSAGAQQKLGQAWAYLKAGCDFAVRIDATSTCSTDDDTVWVDITFHDFGYFDYDGGPKTEIFYLPTRKRLEQTAGKDWY